MGASAKRKKEKQKDFQVRHSSIQENEQTILIESQKPKLKVGKAKAKPENFTDTSFKAKCTILSCPS
jgi:pre-rRNA-processing protein IPI1